MLISIIFFHETTLFLERGPRYNLPSPDDSSQVAVLFPSKTIFNCPFSYFVYIYVELPEIVSTTLLTSAIATQDCKRKPWKWGKALALSPPATPSSGPNSVSALCLSVYHQPKQRKTYVSSMLSRTEFSLTLTA